MVSDACFFIGFKIVTKDNKGNTQTVWRPAQVYHYIQWKEITPDFVLDISEIHTGSYQAYSSQFYDKESKEPSTPISSKNFFESVRYRAKNLGRLAGVDAAEGFTVERTPLIMNFDQLA